MDIDVRGEGQVHPSHCSLRRLSSLTCRTLAKLTAGGWTRSISASRVHLNSGMGLPICSEGGEARMLPFRTTELEYGVYD